jgi:membrane-associated protease RseP (regulator of RpoE activity)
MIALNPPAPGVLITATTPGSQAEPTGLRRGDVIVSYDGNDLKSFRQLRNAVSKRSSEELTSIVVNRGGSFMTLQLKGGRIGVNGDYVKPRQAGVSSQHGDPQVAPRRRLTSHAAMRLAPVRRVIQAWMPWRAGRRDATAAPRARANGRNASRRPWRRTPATRLKQARRSEAPMTGPSIPGGTQVPAVGIATNRNGVAKQWTAQAEERQAASAEARVSIGGAVGAAAGSIRPYY